MVKTLVAFTQQEGNGDSRKANGRKKELRYYILLAWKKGIKHVIAMVIPNQCTCNVKVNGMAKKKLKTSSIRWIDEQQDGELGFLFLQVKTNEENRFNVTKEHEDPPNVDCVLLDSCRTANILGREGKKHLKNLHKLEKSTKIKCNSEIAKTSWMGEFGSFQVW